MCHITQKQPNTKEGSNEEMRDEEAVRENKYEYNGKSKSYQ